MKSASEFATRISRALISASNNTIPAQIRPWTQSLESILHKIVSRDSLNPSLVAQVIDPFLLTHHSLALGFFNWASQQPGFTHNLLTYHSILKSLSLSRQFNAIGHVLKLVKTQKLTLNSSTNRNVISSLIKGRKTQTAYLVFYEVKSQILDIGPEICNSLLALLGSDENFGNGLKVFDEMLVRGVGFSTVGFGVFIWRFCRGGDLGEVLSMLDRVKNGNSEINGSVIAVLIVHGLCRASRVNDALWVLNELRVRDCKPDFMAYRIVAEAFRLSGSVADVDKVLKMKRKLGVAPRSSDYREFILSLIAERLVVEAKDLGEIIVNGNFPIEVDVLNALIGSVSGIDPCSAMLFFRYITGKGMPLTLLTLNNLSRHFLRHGKVDEMLEVYNVLSENDYFSDMESYNVVFSFFCKAGKIREAYGILQGMKKKRLGPDISMYNCLMEACCREDLMRPAKRLWDEMFVTGCGVNLKTYNILIEKFSEISEVEESLRLFNHMLKKGMAPDATTYTCILKGLCQETKFDAAVEIFCKSINQDLMLARSILSTFIINLCKEGQFLAASKLLCGPAYDISHSDSHVVLLKCLADAEEVAVALEHLKWLQDTSPPVLQVISTELLALLSSSSKPESIVCLLQAVSKQSLESNGDSWKHFYQNTFN
ncbi:pentatricopeptide repeat-containing protein At5g14080 [Mercurialis annua]|uniref:pentatricopeptide repeat-containing protein At5g14080 n=1 Tax=Mercurialis annua TaxID=3986 RepID=UPI00215F30A0|nr:pentatricopeptide repeat-containing protein At5g14080 [Mercurialis annua]XP_050232615.1 pentatricopeptide repeat-containing protein At5g14080 [Mercurialis annua]XP_050232616.1 pentatricopeptide repeat-containing protein At5g14080 [Mercurialis annua]XP_050232617.1 pentatricopeptide repeat-containing protein At5g14080 [Mercurialis annua]